MASSKVAVAPEEANELYSSPDGPTPAAAAGAGEDYMEDLDLGMPDEPVWRRSDKYSVKDPERIKAVHTALVKRRSNAVVGFLKKHPHASPDQLDEVIKKAEERFFEEHKELFKEHLKSRFGGRKTRRKSKVRIPIKKNGDLTNLGYSMTKKARTRHGALKKAVKKFGRATVSRKLNALAVLNKRRHPATARKARADRKYTMTQ